MVIPRLDSLQDLAGHRHGLADHESGAAGHPLRGLPDGSDFGAGIRSRVSPVSGRSETDGMHPGQSVQQVEAVQEGFRRIQV